MPSSDQATSPTGTVHPETDSSAILEHNLQALGPANAALAERLRATTPRLDIAAIMTDDGVLAVMDGGRQLCSKRRPLEEARRLIDPIDIGTAAVFAVMGFAAGYHAASLAQRVGRTGVMLVFEPDIGLLRAVLETIDFASSFKDANIAIITDENDLAHIGSLLRGSEGLVGMGVTFVDHPASRNRLGSRAQVFARSITDIVDAIKMTIITTLVQSRVTVRNLLQNLDVYACNGLVSQSGTRSAGISELKDICAGLPALVISAGPSLKRNLQLLKDPSVRERCVLIAAQTVFKLLLAEGIRPHFVTALDYSEINKRFYEGLTAEMVQGITLVIEPKVNPAVPAAWPGQLRCVTDRTLDLLLGDDLKRPMGELKHGATVAHLAYYLARHLGCDPVGLAGQDLGFTDHQYYSAGASIHTVWSSELNSFKSLELMEWHRIMRMGGYLRTVTDHLGRTMYTDEQMLTYLRQFEQDFAADVARGLRIVDATEGGVRKQAAHVAPLAEFLESYVHARQADVSARLNVVPACGAAKGEGALSGFTSDQDRRNAVLERVRMIRRQCGQIADQSYRTVALLREIHEHQEDQPRVNRIIQKIDDLRDDVQSKTPGFVLTNLLSQRAVFNRIRADRQIGLVEGKSALHVQKLRIERDVENVRSLCEGAEDLAKMLDGAAATLEGAPRTTRDLKRPSSVPGLEEAVEVQATVTEAILVACFARTGLGIDRSAADAELDAPLGPFVSVLSATLDRLLRAAAIRTVNVLTDNPERARAALLPQQVADPRVRIVFDPALWTGRSDALASARRWARTSWRGGLGDLAVWDELVDPDAIARLLADRGATAAILAGADWCALDPALTASLIERHAEQPAQHRLTFSQAAPGLSPCLVSRGLAEQVSAGTHWRESPLATLGGMLGWVPMAPVMDLIANSMCVQVTPLVRDAGLRCIADTPRMRALLASALAKPSTGADDVVRGILADLDAAPNPSVLDEITLRVAPSALPSALHAAWRQARGSQPSASITLDVRAAAAPTLARVLTLLGDDLRESNRSEHAGLHLRLTQAQLSPDIITALDRSGLVGSVAGLDVISVDLAVVERGDHGAVTWPDALLQLVGLRQEKCGGAKFTGVAPLELRRPWIVPRLTKCDQNYDIIEPVVAHGVMTFGWLCLDPLEAASSDSRIRPLPWPAPALLRRARAVFELEVT